MDPVPVLGDNSKKEIVFTSDGWNVGGGPDGTTPSLVGFDPEQRMVAAADEFLCPFYAFEAMERVEIYQSPP